VGSARIAALVTSIAAAAPSHAVGLTPPLGSPASLGDAFAGLARAAAELEIEPPEPAAWFTVWRAARA
jgi:hypothetical protein